MAAGIVRGISLGIAGAGLMFVGSGGDPRVWLMLVILVPAFVLGALWVEKKMPKQGKLPASDPEPDHREQRPAERVRR